MPLELVKAINYFHKDDIAQYPGTILKTVLSNISWPNEPLEDVMDMKLQIEECANIKTENPS